MERRKLIAVAAIVVGLALIAVGIVYWIEPASSLPSFFPGHEAGSGHHHVKHGLAAFLVGLACLVFAWFETGSANTGSGDTGSGAAGGDHTPAPPA